MNGTYTQRRRAQMAGGGITSLNMPRKHYLFGKFGDWVGDVKDKIVDDIIPNELKESPIGTALVGGALVNQFGIPDFVPGIGGMGQNWLGELLGGRDLVIGDTAAEKARRLEILGKAVGSTGLIPGTQHGVGDVDFEESRQKSTDILNKLREPSFLTKLGQTIVPGGQTGFFDLYGGGGGGGLESIQPDASGRYPINWKGPLAIGTAIGAADYLTRSEDKMPAQLAIDPSRFATAEAAMADPNLRFKPQAQYANVAEGGRIGYREGQGVESIPVDQMQDIEGQMAGGEYNRAMELMLKLRENIPLTDEEKEELKGLMQTLLLAKGGRVGYYGGGIGSLEAGAPDIKYEGDMRDEGGDVANMDMIALEFQQEYGYDLMLAKPELREWYIKKWMDKNFYDKSEAPGRDRVMAQEGGLMDLGGMEKDYRQEGGFVPIGGQEKADDVPARLSKNEFVFTADAVRNAGGGDIDEGAAVMENLMNHLEAGGKVSEDSQGLEGAQEMFANAQQLEKRII